MPQATAEFVQTPKPGVTIASLATHPGSGAGAPIHVWRNRMSYRVLTASVFLLALTASGCAKNDALVEVKGACADVFTGQVCTWAKVSGSAVVEAGGIVP